MITTTIFLNFLLTYLLLLFLLPTVPKIRSRCEEIKKLRATNKLLISYDVYSLFTGITLKETIDIADDLLLEHNPDFKIAKNGLKKLFDFATSGTPFLFDGSFYDQIDREVMGSHLGPVLAILFMLPWSQFVASI